jgi:hypothetical protein
MKTRLCTEQCSIFGGTGSCKDEHACEQKAGKWSNLNVWGDHDKKEKYVGSKHISERHR